MTDKAIIEEKKSKLVELTSEFCKKFLDEEYSNLSEIQAILKKK
jgi:hypothetical protein